MAARNLVVLGVTLTGAMQLVFLATGFDRGVAYTAVQVIAVVSTAFALWGFWAMPRRGALAAIAGGMAGNVLARALTLALGLSRLPVWMNVLMLVGYALATWHAARWTDAKGEGEARASGLRLAFGLLAVVYFLALVKGVSGGRWTAIAGLALGAVGFALAAPNVEAPAAAPPAAPAPPLAE